MLRLTSVEETLDLVTRSVLTFHQLLTDQGDPTDVFVRMMNGQSKTLTIGERSPLHRAASLSMR